MMLEPGSGNVDRRFGTQEGRDRFMKDRSSGKTGLVCLGITVLTFLFCKGVQAQVKLEYKFPEEKKLVYRTTSKLHQSLTFMGMEVERSEDRFLVESFTTGKRRGDSTLPIAKKVESLRVEMALPDGKLVYDTADPKATVDTPGHAFLRNMFKLAGEVAYTIVLDEHNKVKAVEGAEIFKEKIEKLDPTSQESVRDVYAAEAFKRSFEEQLQIVPDVLARPGEPWERTQVIETGDGQTLSFRKKYEYVGMEKRADKTLDKLSCKVLEVKNNTNPNTNLPLKPTKSDLKVESSDGKILFDRDQGHLVSTTERIGIKGNITYSAGGMEVQTVVDLSIETKVELQPTSK